MSEALVPGSGALDAGLRLDNSLRPAAYINFNQRLLNGLSLYADGQASGLGDWYAQAGLKLTW